MTRKTSTLIGAAAGLALFLAAGLLPSLVYGGYAGVLLAGGIFGTPIQATFLVRALVVFEWCRSGRRGLPVRGERRGIRRISAPGDAATPAKTSRSTARRALSPRAARLRPGRLAPRWRGGAAGGAALPDRAKGAAVRSRTDPEQCRLAGSLSCAVGALPLQTGHAHATHLLPPPSSCRYGRGSGRACQPGQPGLLDRHEAPKPGEAGVRPPSS
jgi:hypothetical protein